MEQNNKTIGMQSVPRKIKTPVQPIMGRVQPQATDVEEAVLGALMLERDAYDAVSDMLFADTFYERKHQQIFSAIQELAINQIPIDMLTVCNQLEQRGELEQVGGRYYIATLTGKVGSAANIEYHAKILTKKALARQIICYSSRINTEAYEETTDSEELLAEAEVELCRISQKTTRDEYEQIGECIDYSIHEIERVSNIEGGISGLPTGFVSIDQITGGLQESNLIIIAARPAMGKTAFALSMAKKIAFDAGIPVGMFNLEMSRKQLSDRLLSNVCEIPLNKIRSGQLTTDEWSLLQSSNITKLKKSPIYSDYTSGISFFELKRKAARMVRNDGVKLLIIDYMQLITTTGMKFGSREQEVTYISKSLKGLAKELNIPIIALSQLSRASESRTDKRPQLADLRESGSIEQDADIVCLIHRPEKYNIYTDNEGNDLRGIATVIFAKNRQGETCDVNLRFIGEFVRFQEIDTKYTPPAFQDATQMKHVDLFARSDDDAPF